MDQKTFNIIHNALNKFVLDVLVEHGEERTMGQFVDWLYRELWRGEEVVIMEPLTKEQGEEIKRRLRKSWERILSDPAEYHRLIQWLDDNTEEEAKFPRILIDDELAGSVIVVADGRTVKVLKVEFEKP